MKKLLASFNAYCAAHPHERFWQALRNWSEANYIEHVGQNGASDTFYWNGRKGQEDDA